MTSTPHRRSRSCHTLSLSPLSQLPRNYLCSGAQGPSAILHPPVGAGASSTEQLTEHVQTPWRAVQPAQRVLAAPAASSELHLHGALVLDLPWKGIFWLWVEADPHTTFNTLRLTPFRLYTFTGQDPSLLSNVETTTTHANSSANQRGRN